MHKRIVYPQKAWISLAEVINEDFIISFITQIEYLGYKDIAKSSEEFVSLADVVEIDKFIFRIALIYVETVK